MRREMPNRSLSLAVVPNIYDGSGRKSKEDHEAPCCERVSSSPVAMHAKMFTRPGEWGGAMQSMVRRTGRGRIIV